MRAAGHVAATVRAHALAGRAAGPAIARRLAAGGDLAVAVEGVRRTPYGHDVRPGQSLAEAQDAVASTLLWHLRVLAGWLPPGGAEPLRIVAGWYEIQNVDRLLRRLRGSPTGPAYRLGALATAWPRLSRVETVDGLRAELAARGWTGPGAVTDREITIGMRLTWARRVAGLPAAGPWAAGAAALLVARERWLAANAAGPPVPALLGAADTATSWPAFLAALPARAAWAFEGVHDPEDLWRGEAVWWRRLQRDASALLHDAGFGNRAVLGAAAALAVDAWRIRAALACAADGGDVAAYDAIVTT